MIKIVKRSLKWSGIGIGLIVCFVLVFNGLIEGKTEHKTYSSVSDIGYNRVGLVLGTSKFLGNGRLNLFFKYRVEAALELYHSKKIDFILISGDNSRKTYDEPTDFKNALIEGGIPESNIYLDYAGFRTLDSVVRAKKIFGLNKMTVISQKFHNQRAIYLSNYYDIEAIGYNAKDVTGKNGLKVKIREYFARTKVFIDLLLGVKPKFLGKTIQIK